ncbi:hypothetical protein GCM10009642_25550 [Nocardiopsis metallicus]|uniref:Uncharacterized protein n=1 Tax=Nocardiopsis metallicus TaxID=179819 RepID=A0A840VXP7_9ACTN|nr:hypothetical protein [Nocardiopsis metallicus]
MSKPPVPREADPPPQAFEVLTWFETEGPEAIVEDPGTEAYQDYLDGLGVRSANEQEIHEPHPVWQWTDEFVRAEAREEEDVLAFTETWVAAVSVNGEPGAIVEATREDDGEIVFAGLATAADAAEGFLELEEGEALVYEFPLNAWYTVADGHLRGVNYEGLLEVPGRLGLEEYDRRTEERYAQDLERPEGTDLIGGAAFTDPSGPAAAWLLPAGLVALILAGAGFAAFRRGSPSTPRPTATEVGARSDARLPARTPVRRARRRAGVRRSEGGVHCAPGAVTARQGTGLDRTIVLEGRPCSASWSMTSSKCSMERTAMSSTQQASPVTRCTWRISGSSSEDRSRSRQWAPKHSMRTRAVTGSPAAAGSTCAW